MKTIWSLFLVVLLCVPAWCQDGKIAFTSKRSGNGDIYVVNPDGSGLTNLSNTASVEEGNARFRGDGGKLVYQRTDALWTMQPDGTNQAVLSQGGGPVWPDFHPSGNPVIFSRPITSGYDICKINIDGSGLSQILSNSLGDYYARWSPDGSKFSFYTFFGANNIPEVCVANADGSGQIRLTTASNSLNANWSPDGGKLVFQSARDGNYEIYIMNADGSGQTRITTSTTDDFNPVYSPDGSKIAFVSNRDGNNEIYVMNVDGSGQARVTNNAADDNSPAWGASVPAGSPTVSVNDAVVTEGDSATAFVEFTVSLSGPSSTEVTVHYGTLNGSAYGTATSPADFTQLPSGSFTFAPGETTKTFAVTVQGDTLDEDDETFAVALYSAYNAFIGDDRGVGTILDNDASPTVSIADASQNEGHANPTNFPLTVVLSEVSGRAVTVSYATADGTATQPGDYTAKSSTVTIPAGSLSAGLSVAVVGDTVREPDETFLVDLSSPVNATINDGQATVTIVNDDFPQLSIAGTTVAEGNSGQVDAEFVVTLAEASTDVVTFNFTTLSGSAQPGTDYTTTTGSGTIQPGDTTFTIKVPVLGDTRDEFDENFFVSLSNLQKAAPGNTFATGTITDNDALPQVSIADLSRYEGNSGTTTFSFVVSLSEVSGKIVSVAYATADGTATQPGDYTARNSTVSIPAGTTSRTFNITVLGDTVKEPNETFLVNLSNPSNATIDDGQATGTILTDDLPFLTIVGSNVTEGDDGQTNATFTLTLSEISSDTVTVDFATSPGTATADVDYVSTNGTRTFLPGETSKTINIPVNGDTIDEADQTFYVVLSNPVNALLASPLPQDPTTGHAYELVAAPLNWDSARTAAAARTYGGVAGHLATITSAGEQNFVANLISGTEAWIGGVQPAGSAEPGGGFGWITGEPFSYTNWRSGEPNNAPNEDVILFSVNGTWNDSSSQAIVQRYLVEYDTDANVGSNSVVSTILDDDAPPALSINDVTIAEDSETPQAVFTISLNGTTEKSIAVDVSTTPATAAASTDYTSVNTTVIIPAGQASTTISVPILSDTLDEVDETFSVNLAGAFNATIDDAQGIGTINDDDATPSLSINDVTLTEGNSGATNAVFTVTLSASSGLAVTVAASTTVGTASEPGDFTMTSQTLTIPAGQTSATFSVPVVGDTLYEADETFVVNLTAATNATLADNQGTGTITNDDSDTTPPTVRFTTSATTPAGTTPVNGSTLLNTNAMPAITGEAADAGTGIDKVLLRLYRIKAGTTNTYEYWNGTSWISTVFYFTTTLSPATGGANVSWNKGSGWPTGTDFSDGTYYMVAIAYDAANKTAAVSSSFKKLTDNELPTVRFTTSATTPVGTTPVNGSTIYNTMPAITGTAADAGSGISKVLLRLYRLKAGTTNTYEYWNGTSWISTVFYFTTTLSPATGGANVSWSKSSGWPTGTDFSDGTYYMVATAYDKANKLAAVSSSFKKLTDNELPTVRFTTSATTPAGTTPVSGSTITGAIPTITGDATDVGSGVAKVELRLHRVVNSIVEFWNGTAWGTTQVKFAATLNPASGGANVSWSKGAGWPTGGNLTDGTYYLTAYATDKANKIASASSNFKKATVAGLSPGAIGSASSAVTLSTAQALADSQSIKLSFTGALSSTSASQTTNYSVSVNGTPVEVQKATYEGASSAVTLQLAVGTLEAGDTVTVSWNLRDSSGQTVRGQTELTVE